MKINFLTVDDVEWANAKSRTIVSAKCDCGRPIKNLKQTIKYGRIKSCGCSAVVKRKNPIYATPEYQVFNAARKRCFNKTDPAYARYGGRGITMCPEWATSFETFWADMCPRPSPDLSLDRLDNDKGYSKENCRWATSSEQRLNSRAVLKAAYCCFDKTTKKWRAYSRGGSGKTARSLGVFNTEVEATNAVKLHKAYL